MKTCQDRLKELVSEFGLAYVIESLDDVAGARAGAAIRELEGEQFDTLMAALHEWSPIRKELQEIADDIDDASYYVGL